MDLFLGIDGGKSSTTAIIGDSSGRILGVGRAGPSNHVVGAEGVTKFTGAIQDVLIDACSKLSLDPERLRFRVVCGGFSGGPSDKEDLLQTILHADSFLVTTDAQVALSGATGLAPGIVAISGTGSIAYGRNEAGTFARAGGWGYVFGDEGSAFDIVRQALRAILRHEEGWGPDTLLREALLSATTAINANDLLHRLYTPNFPRPRIAAYAKLVDQVALEGDSVARGILLNAAQQLAALTSAVHGQLFQETEPCRIAFVGGVFQSEVLLERFRMLVELEDGNELTPAKYGPAVGALLEAYASAGLAVALSNVPEKEK